MKDAKLYIFLRPIITILFKAVYNPKIINNYYITNDNLILAGNHTSILDPILLMSSTKRPIHFLAKKELFCGVKKIIFNHMGLIKVDRQAKNKEALATAYNYLNDNKLIGIFPEGTTEKNRGLLEFKIGAVKMALETNSQIVPFVITGNYKPFKNNLKIEFLKPITVDENLKDANTNLRSIIKKKVDENNGNI